jgi:hypothetical protein
MAESAKKTHFGRAGEYFAMSELLLRGWNVAVPVVDVGDDVFVIDDNDKTTLRLQVKSSTNQTAEPKKPPTFKFGLSRAQLRSPQVVELFYMLLMRDVDRWVFLVIPRARLSAIRGAAEAASKASATAGEEKGPNGPAAKAKVTRGRGRPLVGDDTATTDAANLVVTMQDGIPTGWSANLSEYLNKWPVDMGVISGGPGTVGPARAADDGAHDAGDPRDTASPQVSALPEEAPPQSPDPES